MSAVLVVYRLMAFLVVVAVAAAAVAVMMAVWLAVFVFGLLAPGWTPRRAGDGFLEFIHGSIEQVRSLHD